MSGEPDTADAVAEEVAGRVQPQAVESERAVLGCLLADSATQARVFGRLSKDEFCETRHQEIYAAVEALHDAGDPVDEVTAYIELKRRGTLDEIGGSEYLAGLAEGIVPSIPTANFHVLQIKDAAARRRLIQVGVTAVQRGYQQNDGPAHKAVGDTLDELYALSQRITGAETTTIGTLAGEVLRKADDDSASRRQPILTGWPSVDKFTGDLRGGKLIIPASRTGVGKSTFSQNIVSHLARQGQASLVFTLEDSAEQFVERLIIAESGIARSRLHGRQRDQGDVDKAVEAASRISKWPLEVDGCVRADTRYIRDKARRARAEKNIELVLVDYIQMLETERREKRYVEVGNLSRDLKALAVELGIPVVALSQLNRASEGRADHRPRNCDLRESGALEQDADIIMLLYRPQLDRPTDPDVRGLAEVIISKNRNGSTGIAHLEFLGHLHTFREWGHADKWKEKE